MKKRAWWQESVIYQIYPRSFMDSNNDGNGDIQGIISKLDYLADLGVNGIWLSPIYVSPMKDNGYDVADYFDINPMFGTMADFDELLAEAKKRNIKILMDLVCNHTSTEHIWFKEAIKDKNSKYHDFYIFKDKPDDKKSSFGGSAWCYVPSLNEYYYHYFDESQADLNWANPELRKEVANICKFWLDKGCGGFRLDAIELISKDLENNVFANGPHVHEYLHELNQNAFSLYDEALTVGEGWPTIDICLDYTRPEREELSLIFEFQTATLDWNPKGFGKYQPVEVNHTSLKDIVTNWQTGLKDKSWNVVFLENHDLGRSVTRYGNDGEYKVESAKMLATLMMSLNGTIFLYQGQELGMINPYFKDLDLYDDVDSKTMYKDVVQTMKAMSHDEFMHGLLMNSRDNARTPMHWDNSVNSGFNQGEKTWLTMNTHAKDINVENQINDEDSVLSYYKKLIGLRKSNLKDVFIDGYFERLTNYETTDDLFVYKKTYNDEVITMIINLGQNEIDYDLSLVKDKEIIISNYKDINKKLRAYEAIIIRG